MSGDDVVEGTGILGKGDSRREEERLKISQRPAGSRLAFRRPPGDLRELDERRTSRVLTRNKGLGLWNILFSPTGREKGSITTNCLNMTKSRGFKNKHLRNHTLLVAKTELFSYACPKVADVSPTLCWRKSLFSQAMV